jgi:hypothetical protein
VEAIPINIGLQSGVLFVLMIVVVWLTNKLKVLLGKSKWRWTQRLPSEVWIVIPIVLSIAACYFFKWQATEKLTGLTGLNLTPQQDSIGTGVAVGIAANGAFAAKQAIKPATTPTWDKVNTSQGVFPPMQTGTAAPPAEPVVIAPEPVTNTGGVVSPLPVVQPAQQPIPPINLSVDLLFDTEGNMSHLLLTAPDGRSGTLKLSEHGRQLIKQLL